MPAYQLALLASEQLMPNLEAVAALAAHDALAGVHIHYTGATRASETPARRLADLVAEVAANAPTPFLIHRDDVAGVATPQDVAGWLDRCMARWPDTPWILNATGGTKPMSAAFVDRAGTDGVAYVIYRDLADGWQVFRRHQGVLCMGPPPCALAQMLVEAGSRVDAIDLTRLMTAQFAADGLRVTRSREAAALDAEAMAHDLADNPRSNLAEAWQRSQCGTPDHGKDGLLYEDLVFNLLAAWRPAQIAHSVRLLPERSTGAQDERQEIDIILLHQGQLLILDLKLTREAEGKATPNDQIRTAGQTRRALGGLGARMLLLRPTWLPDDDMRAFASNNQVTLLDAGLVERLFEHIAAILGIETPPTAGMQALQQYHARCTQRGHSPAASGHKPLPRTAGDVALAVDAELDRSRDLRASNWAALLFRGGLYVQMGDRQHPGERVDLAARIELEAQHARNRRGETTLAWRVESANRNTVWLRIYGFGKGRRNAFLQWLAQWPARVAVDDELRDLKPLGKDAGHRPDGSNAGSRRTRSSRHTPGGESPTAGSPPNKPRSPRKQSKTPGPRSANASLGERIGSEDQKQLRELHQTLADEERRGGD